MAPSPAKDATREGRAWKAEEKDIELIEATENSVQLMTKLKWGLIKARLYGGAALVMGLGDDAAKPLDVEKVKLGSLKYIHVLASHELKQGDVITDVNDPSFGLPMHYDLVVENKVQATRIHHSRIVRLLGDPYPDRNVMQQNGDQWADSILQAVNDAVMNVASSTQAVAYLIQEMKLDVIKMPDFMKNMADPTYKATVTERFALATQTKSLTSTLLLDREEEWERIQANFAGMPDVMKLYLLIASGAADIPATRLLGQSAVGLNSTGDGDLKNYYDHIAAVQATELTPALALLDEVILRSALGKRPPDIWYEWAPLWQMTDIEKADLASKKAATSASYVTSGIVELAVMQAMVKNMLVDDGTYPGTEEAYEEFEGLEEDDPEVQEQFAKSKKGEPDDDEEEDEGKPGGKDKTKAKFELKVVGDRYDPDQPRAPKGTEGGGQWRSPYDHVVTSARDARKYATHDSAELHNVADSSLHRPMTDAEREGVEAISVLDAINDSLRAGGNGGEEVDAIHGRPGREHVLALDKLFRDASLSQRIEGYRMVDDATLDALRGKWGTVFEDRGYTSVTTDLESVVEKYPTGGGNVVRVIIPSAAKAMPVSHISSRYTGSDEREVLIARGSRYRVVRDASNMVVLQVQR